MNLQNKLASLPLIDPIRRFVQLERVLAVVLVFVPALLMLVDDGPDRVRGSVSAYHEIARPEAFYVPLTVAAVLFVMNGVLKRGHWYNWVLGILLAMVVVFDHDGASKWAHGVGAVGFFVGNVIAMVWFSKNKSRQLKGVLVGTIVVSGVLWLAVDWFTLFWAEWVSLTIVAVHYILDSAGWTQYSALTVDEDATLIPAA